MKISVVVATYQGERYLAEQLESIATQTRPPDEVVVSDDGSTDATLSIVEDFAARVTFPVVVLGDGRRRGIDANFLRGIEAASGEVLVLADQDNVWAAEKLRMTEEAFSDASVGVVVCDAGIVGPRLEPLGTTMYDALGWSREFRRRVSKQPALAEALRRGGPAGHMLSLRASVRPAVPVWLLAVNGASYDQWIYYAGASVSRLSILDESLVLYRQHDGQVFGAPRSGGVHKKRVGGALPVFSSIAPVAGVLRGFLEHLRCAVEESEELPLWPEAWSFAEEWLARYVQHLDARSRVERRGLARMATVVRELVSGNYFRFSLGLRSAARDALHPRRSVAGAAEEVEVREER